MGPVSLPPVEASPPPRVWYIDRVCYELTPKGYLPTIKTPHRVPFYLRLDPETGEYTRKPYAR